MLSINPPSGAPVWLDLGVPDIPAAAAFYHDVFGWDYVSYGPEAGGYGAFRSDGRTVAAAGPLMAPGASPAWMVYFSTADADAAAKSVEQAGGTVRIPPMEIGDSGRMAGFTDPAGAEFALWEPAANRGIEAVNEPGTLVWAELYSTDVDRALRFYREVFGWTSMAAPMPGVAYHLVSPSVGGPDAMFGGLMQLPEENLAAGNTSEWHPYIGTEDCDATFAAATGRGATVLIPPMDAEGIGRLAMFRDPFGATVAIMKGISS